MEQSKLLLCDLQQAVRASFPPEELLGERAGGSTATPCAAVCEYDHDSQWSGCADSTLEYGGRGHLEMTMMRQQVDPESLGPAPEAQLIATARGVCALPLPVRRQQSRRPRRPPRRHIVESTLSSKPCGLLPRIGRQRDLTGPGQRVTSRPPDDFDDASEDALSRRTDQELLQLSVKIRAERKALEVKLDQLGKSDDVISGLNTPWFLDHEPTLPGGATIR